MSYANPERYSRIEAGYKEPLSGIKFNVEPSGEQSARQGPVFPCTDWLGRARDKVQHFLAQRRRDISPLLHLRFPVPGA